MAKVGFIGLGIMGAPMAANLQAGGHKLYLHDNRNPPATLIEGGRFWWSMSSAFDAFVINDGSRAPFFAMRSRSTSHSGWSHPFA